MRMRIELLHFQKLSKPFHIAHFDDFKIIINSLDLKSIETHLSLIHSLHNNIRPLFFLQMTHIDCLSHNHPFNRPYLLKA